MIQIRRENHKYGSFDAVKVVAFCLFTQLLFPSISYVETADAEKVHLFNTMISHLVMITEQMSDGPPLVLFFNLMIHLQN